MPYIDVLDRACIYIYIYRYAEDEEQLSVALPRSPEAQRRLAFFARSLASPQLPTSAGVLSAPGLTVLVYVQHTQYIYPATTSSACV